VEGCVPWKAHPRWMAYQNAADIVRTLVHLGKTHVRFVGDSVSVKPRSLVYCPPSPEHERAVAGGF